MQRTNIYLEERQTAALDVVARRDGVTRAEVVRRLIDRGLEAEERSLGGDLEAIAASAGALADEEWDPPLEDEGSDRARHLARMWQL